MASKLKFKTTNLFTPSNKNTGVIIGCDVSECIKFDVYYNN